MLSDPLTPAALAGLCRLYTKIGLHSPFIEKKAEQQEDSTFSLRAVFGSDSRVGSCIFAEGMDKHEAELVAALLNAFPALARAAYQIMESNPILDELIIECEAAAKGDGK